MFYNVYVHKQIVAGSGGTLMYKAHGVEAETAAKAAEAAVTAYDWTTESETGGTIIAGADMKLLSVQTCPVNVPRDTAAEPDRWFRMGCVRTSIPSGFVVQFHALEVTEGNRV